MNWGGTTSCARLARERRLRKWQRAQELLLEWKHLSQHPGYGIAESTSSIEEQPKERLRSAVVELSKVSQHTLQEYST